MVAGFFILGGDKMSNNDFICEDCKYHVYGFGFKRDAKLCVNCQWLKDHPDASEEIKAIIRGERK